MLDFQISEVILPETVDLNIENVHDKDELFRYAASLFKKAGKVDSEEEYIDSLYEREEMGSTYMGNNMAIPHGKSNAVNSPCIAFCRSNNGINYKSNNEAGNVKLMFILAIPKKTAPDDYIKVLSTLARLLMHEEFVDALYNAEKYDDVISAVKETKGKLLNE